MSREEKARSGAEVAASRARRAALSPSTTPTGTAPPRPRSSDNSRSSGKSSVVWRCAKALVVVGLIASAIGVALVVSYVRSIEAGLPSVAELKTGYRPPLVTRVLARDGSTLAELFTERRTLIHVADLPPHVKLAVLAAEDASFYEHEGINYLGIARAALVNLRHGGKSRQGASTITQQVVKNLLLDPEKTYTRKVKEALLARRIEQELKKDEILELYLNHIYFGFGRYGIEEAARGYFGKHAKDLTLAEAAILAGLVPAPNLYNPRADMDAALKRRSFVLGQLLEKGFIVQSAYDAAMVEPVKLAAVEESSDDLAPEVIELVRKAIREAVGDEAARRGGFTVQTTIDPALQRAARAAVREASSAYDKRWKLQGPFPVVMTSAVTPTKKGKKKPPPSELPFKGTPRFGHGDSYVGVVVGHDDEARTVDVDVGDVHGVVTLAAKDRYDPSGLLPSVWAPKGSLLRVSLQAPPPVAGVGSAAVPAPPPAPPTDARVPLRLELGPEASLVSIDVRTRNILALVGSVEGAVGGLDRAVQAHRQPGSTFKPFVYGAAMAAHVITPATLIDATSGDFGGWNPKNFEAWTRDEPVRIREALAASINLVAVRVAQMVGPQAVIDFARRAGITSPLKPDLAIALGSYEVTPLELATAYGTFASGGSYQSAQLITRITGSDGKEIPLPKSIDRVPPVTAMSEAEAYMVTSLMTSVVDHGTATGAKALGRPVAGKTGTSNLAKDTWFAGFTTDVVTVVWVGNDDGRPLGAGEFGGRTALPAWVAYMKEAIKGKAKVDFPRPPGVETVAIDPKTGKLPYPGEDDAIDEIFLAGTEPTEASPSPEDAIDAGLGAGSGDDDAGGDAGDAALPRVKLPPPEDPWAPGKE